MELGITYEEREVLMDIARPKITTTKIESLNTSTIIYMDIW